MFVVLTVSSFTFSCAALHCAALRRAATRCVGTAGRVDVLAERDRGVRLHGAGGGDEHLPVDEQRLYLPTPVHPLQLPVPIRRQVG